MHIRLKTVLYRDMPSDKLYSNIYELRQKENLSQPFFPFFYVYFVLLQMHTI